MVRTLSAVFEDAERAFAAGRWADALRGYVAVIQAAPRFTRARYRVGDALLNLGDRQHAKEVYKSLAWHYIRAGHPLLGLVVCKMVLALDPSYEELLHILAALYSSDSERVGDVPLPAPLPLPDGAPAPDVPNLDAPTLMTTAAQLAADTDAIQETPPRFPRIPLFSHLSEEAFVQVLMSLQLKRCTHGETIVRQGDLGDSVYLVADGVVSISKQVTGRTLLLAHLYQGAVFGEMALMSQQPRAATVTAQGDVDLLVLTRSDLETHANQLQSVQTALRRFTRGRLLANLAATSPLFANLSKPERRRLMAEFQPRRVGRDDILIEEGEDGQGLFLVVSGTYEVSSAAQGRLAVLSAGDVFGEISLLRDSPTVATVVAATAGEVLILPKATFRQVLQDHPVVQTTLEAMSEDRLRARGNSAPVIAVEDEMILL